MAAMVLLRRMTAEDIFLEFLHLRQLAVTKQLRRDGKGETAKTLMCRSMGMILSTINVLNRAFVGGEERRGMLEALLDSISEPTMKLFQTRLSPVFKYLPPIVSNFTPAVLEPLRNLEPAYLQGKTTEWLDTVHHIISTEVAAVLSHVASISSLSSIRRGCYEFLKDPSGKGDLTPQKWSSLCNEALGRELSLWDEYYKGAFRDRAEALVTSHVAGSIYCIQSTLSDGEQVAKPFQAELDLSLFLWSEGNLGEIDYATKYGDSKQNMEKPSSLELKAFGYSRQVQDLCCKFDRLLEKLLEDLDQYINGKQPGQSPDRILFLLDPHKPGPGPEEPFDLGADSQAILLFTQDCIVSHMHDLQKLVSSQYLHQSRPATRGLMLFLGRFFQALPELCPAVQKCALAPQALARQEEELVTSIAVLQQRRTMAARIDPKWAELKANFEAISCQVSSVFSNIISVSFRFIGIKNISAGIHPLDRFTGGRPVGIFGSFPFQ